MDAGVSANEGFTPMAILAGIIMMSEWTYIYNIYRCIPWLSHILSVPKHIWGEKWQTSGNTNVHRRGLKQKGIAF